MQNHDGNSLVRPSNYGVVFLLAWIVLLFETEVSGSSVSSLRFMGNEYLWSVAFLMVTMAAISLVPIDRRAFLTNRAVMVVAPITMSVGTALCVLSGFGFGYAFAVGGGFLTGVSSAVLSLQWVVVYQSFGLETVAVSYPVLLACTVCLGVSLLYFDTALIIGAMVVFPLASGGMLWVSMKSDAPDPAINRFDRASLKNYLIFVLFILAFAVPSGYLDYISDQGSYTNVFYALVTLAALITAGAFIFIADRRDFLSAFAVPVAFLAVTLIPYASLYHTNFDTHFIIVGDFCVEVVLFVSTLCFSDYLFTRPIATYTICRITMALANTFGWFLAGSIDSTTTDSGLDAQLALVAIFIGLQVLIIMFVVIVAMGRHRIDQSRTVEVGDEPSPSDGLDVLDERCRFLGKEYGLSNREFDVLRLLARGYSSAKIQQDLFIAAGTVNFHTRNIYAKMNVHSKQEIIDLVLRQSQKRV